jgi:hypothetical protein
MTDKLAVDPRITQLPPEKWCRAKTGKGRVCRTAGHKNFGGRCEAHKGKSRCCGGVSRQGTADDGWPADCTAGGTGAGGRCKWHGGANHPGGPSHPNWKGGRWSKFLPKGIRERFQEAMEDPELLRIRQDMALLDAIITGHQAKLKDGRLPTAPQEARLLKLIDQRRRLADSESRRQTAMHQSVSLMQFLTVMRVVAEIIRKYVTNDDDRRKAQLEIQRLLLARDESIDGELIQGGDDGGDSDQGKRGTTAGGGESAGPDRP